MRKSARTLVPVFAALCALALVLTPTLAQSTAFLESFDGTPATPQPYQNPHNWGIFVQGFDSHFNGLPGQVAQHGPGCEPPGFPYTAGNTHPLRSEADTVFLCNDHLMTAVGLTGYGAIYMQIPAVANLAGGSASISWNMSTLRTAARDWIDLVLTPWAEQSEMAYNNLDQHIPPHNIHVSLAGTNVLLASQRVGGGTAYNQGNDVQLPQDLGTTWDTVFEANGVAESASRRDRFEITLTRTTISVCMPDYPYRGQPFCWMRNAPLAEPLDPSIWHDQVAVQISHRSYNPEKSCSEVGLDGYSAYGDANCPPNTWHWDNVSIQPHLPFAIVKSVPETLQIRSTSATRVAFAAPAPAGSFLHFVQFGETSQLRISWDNGATWIAPRLQPAVAPSTENGEAIWTQAPTGAQSVMVRGANGFWGSYAVEAFKLIGPPSGTGSVSSTPVATSTVTPTATPTLTAVPGTATPISTATAAATATNTIEPTSTATPIPNATSTPTPIVDATPTPTPVPICEVNVRLGGVERGWVLC